MSLSSIITQTCYGDLKGTLTAPIVHYMDLRDEGRGFSFYTRRLEDHELVRSRVLLFREMAKSVIEEDEDWESLQRNPTYLDMENLRESLRDFYRQWLNWVYHQVDIAQKDELDSIEAECDFMWLEHDLEKLLEQEGMDKVFD